MSQIRIDSRGISKLLDGEEIDVVFRGEKLPARLESHDVVLQEGTDVRVFVLGSKLRPRAKRAWDLTLKLDQGDRGLILNAESGGGVIIPLGEGHHQGKAAEHGYVEHPKNELADAGEAPSHVDVENSARSSQSRARFTLQHASRLANKRHGSLSRRVNDALVQAHAHGVDTVAAEAAIEAALAEIRAATQDAQQRTAA